MPPPEPEEFELDPDIPVSRYDPVDDEADLPEIPDDIEEWKEI